MKRGKRSIYLFKNTTYRQLIEDVEDMPPDTPTHKRARLALNRMESGLGDETAKKAWDV